MCNTSLTMVTLEIRSKIEKKNVKNIISKMYISFKNDNKNSNNNLIETDYMLCFNVSIFCTIFSNKGTW